MKGKKNGGKTISSFFHYFEENAQYRIERSPDITGDLKRENHKPDKSSDLKMKSQYKSENILQV